jgi:hypothetical protein
MLINNTEQKSLRAMERKTNKCETLQSFWKKCYIKREDGRMGKFDSRVDKGVIVGYSSTRKA